jgi:hypothetical protein
MCISCTFLRLSSLLEDNDGKCFSFFVFVSFFIGCDANTLSLSLLLLFASFGHSFRMNNQVDGGMDEMTCYRQWQCQSTLFGTAAVSLHLSWQVEQGTASNGLSKKSFVECTRYYFTFQWLAHVDGQ